MAMITTARWADEAHTCICAERDGRALLIPNDMDNYDRAEIDALGIVIGEYAPPPPLVPESVSDRQFFQALADAGLVSWDEALAAVKTGALPSSIENVLVEMTESDRRRAEMLLSGATTFERRHPLTDALAMALGYSSAQTDDLFRAAAAL